MKSVRNARNQLRQNGQQFSKRQLSSKEAKLYRTLSVPEHMQKQTNCDKVKECLDQKSIEMIKKRILDSIDNADVDQVDIEEADAVGEEGFELSRQVSCH